MRPLRLRLCRELIFALNLDKIPSGEIVPASAASAEELLLIHDPEYIAILKEADSGCVPTGSAPYGLGAGDNPVFKGVYRWSSLSAGASLQAAKMVLGGEAKRAFNIAGGLHHAHRARASGFCYINDAALAIEYLLRAGKRVAYVDIDAHHGDGVQEFFYNTDKVLTISLHETGASLFPGTGFVEERGHGAGEGYSVNVPLPPGTGDELYLRTFKAIVPRLISAFNPHVLVTQLGADSLYSDPLTHLNLTIKGFIELVRLFAALNLPWVALGGGGYDIGATAAAWALGWAVMNDLDVPEEIPLDFIARYPGVFAEGLLRGGLKADVVSESASVDKTVDFILDKILPSIKNR